MQLPQRLFAVRHEIALIAQFAEVCGVKRRRVGLQTVFREKDAEAFDIECLFCDLAPLKALPELRVERAVALPHLRRERQAEGAERDGKRVPGAGLKVKQRIVNVHEQCANRHIGSLPQFFV